MMDWMTSAQSAAAVLPPLCWQQWWLVAGWAVVVAWLGALSLSRWTFRKDGQLAMAAGLAIWVGIPGPWGGSYWLGLAFQAPSLTTVLLCASLLVRMFLWPRHSPHLREPWPPYLISLVLCGVALGWVLLLDTLGVWPGSFYNLGFGEIAPAIAIVIAALPWIADKKLMPSYGVASAVSATLLFSALHLPSGNFFDALIDPWLWCYLQFALIERWRYRFKLG